MLQLISHNDPLMSKCGLKFSLSNKILCYQKKTRFCLARLKGEKSGRQGCLWQGKQGGFVFFPCDSFSTLHGTVLIPGFFFWTVNRRIPDDRFSGLLSFFLTAFTEFF